jgi:hypothetical protein
VSQVRLRPHEADAPRGFSTAKDLLDFWILPVALHEMPGKLSDQEAGLAEGTQRTDAGCRANCRFRGRPGMKRQERKKFLARKITLAGRSARRRMK